MKGKKWLLANLTAVVLLLGIICGSIIYVDPYFHYHKPHTDKYYYELKNQRSVNNGIMRHFDYDAIITGTSLTENFSSSELDALFGTNSIKVPTSGGSYYEVNNHLCTAIDNNPNVRMAVRCLDTYMLLDPVDKMRNDLGVYPEHLYDEYYYNDVKYVLNRDIIFEIIVPMIMEKHRGTSPGIDSFDDYSNWYEHHDFGPDILYPDKTVDLSVKGEAKYISGEQAQDVAENIEANVCKIARENPNIEFYYYLSPYSAAWWQQQNQSGDIYKYLEAERIAIEHILTCDNIKLFSFSTNTDITADLNHYKDTIHYAPWINSMILVWMSRGEYILTEENYENYLEEMETIYTGFDYNLLLRQEDYKEDWLAAEKLEEKYNCTLSDYTRTGVYKITEYN